MYFERTPIHAAGQIQFPETDRGGRVSLGRKHGRRRIAGLRRLPRPVRLANIDNPVEMNDFSNAAEPGARGAQQPQPLKNMGYRQENGKWNHFRFIPIKVWGIWSLESPVPPFMSS